MGKLKVRYHEKSGRYYVNYKGQIISGKRLITVANVIRNELKMRYDLHRSAQKAHRLNSN